MDTIKFKFDDRVKIFNPKYVKEVNLIHNDNYWCLTIDMYDCASLFTKTFDNEMDAQNAFEYVNCCLKSIK